LTTYRNYAGRGTVTFRDGYAIPDAPFSVECKTNGRVEITITLQSMFTALEVSNRGTQPARLQGQVTTPPARLTISSITLSNAKGSSSGPSELRFLATGELRITSQGVRKSGVVTLRFGLINFLLAYSMHLRILNDTFTFDPLEDYQALRHRLSAGEPQLTTEVTILTPSSRISSYEYAMRDIVLLISFAMGTYVSIAYMDVLLDDIIVLSVIYNAKVLEYNDSVPVIDLRYGSGQLQVFLAESFQHYQALKKRLRLDLALEYCVLAKTASYLNLKFVTTFISLESLLTRLQNKFPKQESRHGRLLVNRIERTLFFFRRRNQRSIVLARLRRALQYYGLSDSCGVSVDSPPDGTPNYARIRNWLVHGGTFPKSVNALRATYSLLDIYQRLLLVVLSYKGEYIDCSVQPFVNRLVS